MPRIAKRWKIDRNQNRNMKRYRALVYKAASHLNKKNKEKLKGKPPAVVDVLENYYDQLTDVPRLDPATMAKTNAWLEAIENAKYYVSGSFRSVRKNHVFMFLTFDYIVIDCDPARPRQNRLVKGPLLICDGFPSLYASMFHEYGVDAAFNCHGTNEAYLFNCSECVKIRYDPDTHMGDIVEGGTRLSSRNPGYINWWFPFLDYEFRCGLDAAFESTVVGEVYFFRHSRYALLNYSEPKLISTGLITDAFPCLKNTDFSSDIGGSFASHRPNQAYLFKDNSYVLIHYNPLNVTDSYVIVGPEEIVPNNWPSLQGIMPYNCNGRDDIEPTTWRADWIEGGLM